MADVLQVRVNGVAVAVPAGSSVLAAIALAGGAPCVTRRSVSGQPRGPLCGMGVCQECRVTVDGCAHRLGCQTLCAEGMAINTVGAE